jgi:hypothetical protein
MSIILQEENHDAKMEYMKVNYWWALINYAPHHEHV